MAKSFFIEDLYNNKDAIDWKIHSELNKLREGNCGGFIDKIVWIWYIFLKPKLFYIISFVASILSVMIVVGELSIMF